MLTRERHLVVSSKDNRTVVLTGQDFFPDRTADGALLFTFSSNNLDFRRSLSFYLKFGSRNEHSSRFYRKQGCLATRKSRSDRFKSSFSNVKLVSEVNCSRSSNICLIGSRSSLKRLKGINKSAISTLNESSQRLVKNYIMISYGTSCSKHVAPVCLILSAVGKSLLTHRCKTFCFAKLNSARSPQSHQCLNGFFLPVFIVAVSFLRIPFPII